MPSGTSWRPTSFESSAAGYAHGDLSAYNLLWWADELWLIDLPQAVDIAANPMGLDFLHRDVVNITTWFARQGLDRDPEELFALLLDPAHVVTRLRIVALNARMHLRPAQQDVECIRHWA